MKFHASSHLVLMVFYSPINLSDPVEWQPLVTIDLEAHLEEWQLHLDKLASAHPAISLQPDPLIQRARNDTVVQTHWFLKKDYFLSHGARTSV